MLYQVLYRNGDDTTCEYVVSGNSGSAEMRADLKMVQRIKAGFLSAPFSRWICMKVKEIDDIPYNKEDSQVFYV